MEATQTQMNVRIDTERKAAGDAVLAQFNLTPTYAVRALWDHLATRKSLPDFMAAGDDAVEPPDPAFATLAEEGAGLAMRLARQAGVACNALQDLGYDELVVFARDDRFDAWEDHGV